MSTKLVPLSRMRTKNRDEDWVFHFQFHYDYDYGYDSTTSDDHVTLGRKNRFNVKTTNTQQSEPPPGIAQYDIFFSFLLSHFCFPASGQAVVTCVVPSLPRFLSSFFIAHRVQQSRLEDN